MDKSNSVNGVTAEELNRRIQEKQKYFDEKYGEPTVTNYREDDNEVIFEDE